MRTVDRIGVEIFDRLLCISRCAAIRSHRFEIGRQEGDLPVPTARVHETRSFEPVLERSILTEGAEPKIENFAFQEISQHGKRPGGACTKQRAAKTI